MKNICLLCLLTLIQSVNLLAQEIQNSFSKKLDAKKFESMDYLLKNLKNQFSQDGESVRRYDTLFPILRTMQPRKMLNNEDINLKRKWLELIQEYGLPSEGETSLVSDSLTITQSFLEKNVELAYKVRERKQWLVDISDSMFNEFVLPYRIGLERIEYDSRARLFERYEKLYSKTEKESSYKSSMNNDLLAFANNVQFDIWRRVGTNATMWNYPFDIPVSKIELGRLGACTHLANYTVHVMRAVGIPVSVDFTNLWGNNRTGHTWNVLFRSNTSILPFDASTYPLSFDISDRKVVKVYRKRFSPTNHNAETPSPNEVPASLVLRNVQDVTVQYTNVSDVILKVPDSIAILKKFVLIGTFDNRSWRPQSYSALKGGKATFKSMGNNNVYIGMYLDGTLKTFGEPFLLDSLGKIVYFNGNNLRSDMLLTRKYHSSNQVKMYMQSMVGGEFQASNNSDFNEYETLFKIRERSEKLENIHINSLNSFRYIRYRPGDNKNNYVGEISFYFGKRLLDNKVVHLDSIPNLDKINDKDLGTYCTLTKGQCVTFDLGVPQNLTQIDFVPRSDTNFILAGDRYELCYWVNGGWKSTGQLIATDSKLLLKSIPQGYLFVLHNLTRGSEERIFKYSNGKQVWF